MSYKSYNFFILSFLLNMGHLHCLYYFTPISLATEHKEPRLVLLFLHILKERKICYYYQMNLHPKVDFPKVEPFHCEVPWSFPRQQSSIPNCAPFRKPHTAASHPTGKWLSPKEEVTPFSGICSFQFRTHSIKNKWALYSKALRNEGTTTQMILV